MMMPRGSRCNHVGSIVGRTRSVHLEVAAVATHVQTVYGLVPLSLDELVLLKVLVLLGLLLLLVMMVLVLVLIAGGRLQRGKRTQRGRRGWQWRWRVVYARTHGQRRRHMGVGTHGTR